MNFRTGARALRTRKETVRLTAGLARNAWLIVAVLCFGLLFGGCGRERSAVTPVPAHSAAQSRFSPSTDCRSCHEAIHQAWSGSHHAHAHRPIDPEKDRAAFLPARDFSLNGLDYRVSLDAGQAVLREARPGQPAQSFVPEFVLAYTPLRQYVVPVGKGRYQLTELAFDPAKQEWFNVYGDERRQPGEWGHWLGRGMTWNSMCAHCHMTGFDKKYDFATDSYASQWTEHGVGCTQCHGNLPANHADPNRPPAPRTAFAAPAERRRSQETCAPCHARNELLTGTVVPGAPYHDHYRLTLPTEASVFYPDGQMRDEVFNYTSFLISRMGGKAGVTCLDCHDPHSGRTLLPAENNAICLQCHGAPGRQNAIVIDPLAHSHHAADSKGNQCVACHMPMTTYMQRDPRHDHGFLKPDPLLTKELGIPNACNGCHKDQTVNWAIAHTDSWYGDKMNSRQRERARVVAAAQAEDAGITARLLDFIANEDIPAWKATLLLLSRPYSSDIRVTSAARAALQDADPLVRSAAVQVLSGNPEAAPAIEPLLADPSRVVRLDAAWALSPQLPDASQPRSELEAYLRVSADQPTGRLRIGQDLFNRGRAAEAVAPLRLATEWDPYSAGMQETLGLVLDSLGRGSEAAAALWRAAQLEPGAARPAFNAALAFASAQKLPDAELALREALRRDPRFDRAWYNLGLLLVQTGRADEGLKALRQAESIAPQTADYPYARATIHWQRGERDAAIVAARRVLEIDPTHAGARQLVGPAR